MTQHRDRIALADAIRVFDEWLSRGRFYLWSQTPEEVRQNLIREADENGVLDYHRAVAILYAAQTSKLRGDANAGIQYIRQEWKKLKYL